MATYEHATILDPCSVEVSQMIGPHNLIIMSQNKIREIQYNLHKTTHFPSAKLPSVNLPPCYNYNTCDTTFLGSVYHIIEVIDVHW